MDENPDLIEAQKLIDKGNYNDAIKILDKIIFEIRYLKPPYQDIPLPTPIFRIIDRQIDLPLVFGSGYSDDQIRYKNFLYMKIMAGLKTNLSKEIDQELIALLNMISIFSIQKKLDQEKQLQNQTDLEYIPKLILQDILTLYVISKELLKHNKIDMCLEYLNKLKSIFQIPMPKYFDRSLITDSYYSQVPSNKPDTNKMETDTLRYDIEDLRSKAYSKSENYNDAIKVLDDIIDELSSSNMNKP